MAHTLFMLDKQGYTHAHTSGHPHACARTRKDKCVILIAFPQQQWFVELASVLRYTYIACLVLASTSVSSSYTLVSEDDDVVLVIESFVSVLQQNTTRWSHAGCRTKCAVHFAHTVVTCLEDSVIQGKECMSHDTICSNFLCSFCSKHFSFW